MSDKLFSTYQLGDYTLNNRVVMAPMTRSRAVNNNAPGELEATYYAQRAGAGLIITEGVSPSANGLGYARIPGAYSEAQKAGWKLVADAVHAKGGKIFMQMMHTGRVSSDKNMPEGAEVVAPTTKTKQGEMWVDADGMVPHTTPREMTSTDIQQAIEEYATAAKNAVEAGIDGIEVHGANGYLIEQFINPNVNTLTNEYGADTVENRVRFLLDVTKAVVDAVGAGKVGVRISPYGAFGVEEGHLYDQLDETYVYIAEELSKLGVAYIHVVDHSTMGSPEVPASIKAKIREAFNGTYILSGGYTKETAEADLEAGKGDVVAFGRAFIANPDLVERFKQNAELADADQSTFYMPGEKGYTDYPTLAEANA
tara:strand:+ start:1893 stop:2996 length:1104 start_codon:yes stop_codon:yes gene_type:complete